ncbi:MAG: Vitamin B12 dependent methionine synthase activation subunit [Clostridia bacterium]|nr:Vitamin B12 dependent methionine synthase activation subunit [Clostridia bacterium]
MIDIGTMALSDITRLKVNRGEAMRYLGVKEDDCSLTELLDQGETDALSVSSPRAVYVKVPIAVEGKTVDFGFMKVESERLVKNLEGCNEAYVFCATLGISADRHYEKLARISQARAAVFSASCSSLIESFCDYVNGELARDKRCKPRFSCGYGDFCIKHQADILNVLEASKRLGVCLTDSYMMVPVKTVTAVIGIRR